MPKFKPYNYDQSSIVVINYEEQLQTGTFEHAIHYLIRNKLDLSIFHSHFNNDDVGRKAYDPAILLQIILFAYSKGITSSREIQWCCATNIIFKALSCDSVPHFTTIAHFVSAYPDAIEQLFEQVLLVCHEQGLLGTNSSLSMAVSNRPMHQKSGRAPSRNSKKSAVKSNDRSSTTLKNIKRSIKLKIAMKNGINEHDKPSIRSTRPPTK